jgi:hypothetical protein
MSRHIDEPAKQALESLRRFTTSIAGSERQVVLYPPSYDAVVRGLIERQGLDLDILAAGELVPRERVLIMGELIQILEVDGQSTYPDNADPILDDRAGLEAILQQRECLYRFLVDQGRIYTVCPRCGVTTELDLAFYARVLALPIRLTDRSVIALPALAEPPVAPPPLTRPYEERMALPRRSAARPTTVPRATRIDFVVPSARVGISDLDDVVTGTIGDIEQAREIEAWRRWAPPRMKHPSDQTYYSPDHPGFRASLRLAVALAELRTEDARVVEPTPATIANMYLADVQFLDLLHTATHDLAVETPSATIHCGCGQAYLPVR